MHPGADDDRAGVDVLAASIDGVRDEVFQLKDLFRRRLMEDKARLALAQTVDDQLRNLQTIVRHQAVEQFVGECLLVVDRLMAADGADPALPRSAAEELLEVFRRRGLQTVGVDAGFDARVHQVVDTRPAESAHQVDAVLAVERDGYLFGDHLLRPARVTVGVRTRV